LPAITNFKTFAPPETAGQFLFLATAYFSSQTRNPTPFTSILHLPNIVFAPELLVAISIVPVLESVLTAAGSTSVSDCFCDHMPSVSHFTYFEPRPNVLLLWE